MTGIDLNSPFTRPLGVAVVLKRLRRTKMPWKEADTVGIASTQSSTTSAIVSHMDAKIDFYRAGLTN